MQNVQRRRSGVGDLLLRIGMRSCTWLANAWQCVRTGQAKQRGDCGTQIIAPNSIIAELKSPAFCFGVKVSAVVADSAPAVRRYDPSHPDADADGFVNMPAINPVEEMADLMSAARSYELNASAVQATRGMIQQSLDLLK